MVNLFKILFNPLSFVLFLSVLITGIIAYCLGYVTHYFAPDIGLASAILFFVSVQMIVFSVRYSAPAAPTVEIQPQEQVAQTACSYCGIANDVPIRWGSENRYQCVSCKGVNVLIVTATSTQASIVISKS